LDFIETTAIPVVQASRVFRQAMGRGPGKGQLLNYSEIIAHDLVYEFVEELLKEVRIGASTIIGADQASLDSWVESLRGLETSIALKQSDLDAKITATTQLVEIIDKMKKPIAGRFIQKAVSADQPLNGSN